MGSVLIPIGLFAQDYRATLLGQVSDASGAAVPNATVRAIRVDSNQTTEVKTTATGFYSLPYLNPGVYEVTYEAQGFKKLVRTSIQVRSTETVSVDVTLELGSVVESVEVSARSSVLETETSTTGHLVTGVEINKLPSPQMKLESMLADAGPSAGPAAR